MSKRRWMLGIGASGVAGRMWGDMSSRSAVGSSRPGTWVDIPLRRAASACSARRSAREASEVTGQHTTAYTASSAVGLGRR